MRALASFALAFALAACHGDPPYVFDAAVDVLDASDVSDAGTPDADASTACTGTYPAGPYGVETGNTLPDLRFATADGEIALDHYYAPCAETPRLLVLRTFAAWSGPSQWGAAHTTAITGRADAARIDLVDLLALGQDNLPAVPADLPSWRARYDVAPTILALDPEYHFVTSVDTPPLPPLVITVDTRSMRVIWVDRAPSPGKLAYVIDDSFAILRGAHAQMPVETLHDGRFTDEQWDLIRAMAAPGAPPADPTNRFADDPRAAALGADLFTDTGLSPAVSACSSCHASNHAFGDARATGLGIEPLDRNTPSIFFTAYTRWLFWDGRADSQWGQALGPLENDREMSSSRLYIAHQIATRYATRYTALFGPLPALDDTARFPANGKPGEPDYDTMAAADRDAVDAIFVNVGKSLAAFERTVHMDAAPIDAYVAGDTNALTVAQRDGLLHFVGDAFCIQCHYGPRLTDDSFHNIVMPTGREDGMPDTGRLDGIAPLVASRFTARGPFSDAPDTRADEVGITAVEAMRGQFRTPSLRGVSATGPWGHGGTFTTLRDVMVHYGQRADHRAPDGTTGTQDIHLGGFHTMDATPDDLAALMDAFTPASLRP